MYPMYIYIYIYIYIPTSWVGRADKHTRQIGQPGEQPVSTNHTATASQPWSQETTRPRSQVVKQPGSRPVSGQPRAGRRWGGTDSRPTDAGVLATADG